MIAGGSCKDVCCAVGNSPFEVRPFARYLHCSVDGFGSTCHANKLVVAKYLSP